MITESGESNIDPILNENEQLNMPAGELDMESRVSKVTSLKEIISLLEEIKQIPGKGDIKYDASDLVSRIENAVKQIIMLAGNGPRKLYDPETYEEIKTIETDQEKEINRMEHAFPLTYGLRDKIVELLKKLGEEAMKEPDEVNWDDVPESEDILNNMEKKQGDLYDERKAEERAAKELYGEDVYKQKVKELRQKYRGSEKNKKQS